MERRKNGNNADPTEPVGRRNERGTWGASGWRGEGKAKTTEGQRKGWAKIIVWIMPKLFLLAVLSKKSNNLRMYHI